MRKHQEDVRREKNETHTDGTSGAGQNANTRMADPYMNSLYAVSDTHLTLHTNSAVYISLVTAALSNNKSIWKI